MNGSDLGPICGKCYPGICTEGMIKTTKMSVRIVAV